MTPDEFIRLLRDNSDGLRRLCRDVMPVLAGNLAKRHIDDDFRRGGFTHNGFTPWKATRRQQAGTGAQAEYGPLLSGRNVLSRATDYRAEPYRVTVSNDTPYAALHNRGGTVQPRVTDKMRRFAWAMYYKQAGAARLKEKAHGRNTTESEEAMRWKRLALTRKRKLLIRIPRRQFMPEEGIGSELRRKIQQKMEQRLRALLGV